MLFKKKCKITFIRHGATINTEENRFFDDEAFPAINANGKSEIEKMALWVRDKGLKIDKIYSSSALRCEQSARILSSICNKEFEVVQGLTARKTGLFSGLSFEEVEYKYPNSVEKYFKNASQYTPECAESIVDFNERIQKIINDIIEQNLNKRLVIVTHGVVIQAVVSNALGIPFKQSI